ncbi:MAG: sulfotransferase domain-containing protein [Deltaproteobacteria bacterium]|nr:sulfotransferase domain-containing protein [Deltaproteobacteria bacterium]
MRNVTWLVSYPRSGNTWTRLLLTAILSPDEVGYRKIDELVPDTHRFEHEPQVLKEFRKRKDLPFLVLKSHYIHPWGFEPGDKFIYLYRDPRDVALSEYYFRLWEREALKVSVPDNFTMFLKREFIRETRFGSWKSHVSFWTQTTDKASLIYEHTEDILFSVLGVLGYSPTEEEVKRAVELTSFSRCVKMAASEEVHKFKRGLKGRPRRWKEEMTDEQQEIIKNFCGDLMKTLGYL